MKYCTYLTVYFGKKLPRRYIGSSTVARVKTGYTGSIKSKKWKAIYAEEQTKRKHLFRTKILSYHSTQLEAVQKELELQKRYDVVNSLLYMNEALATPHGFFGHDTSGTAHPMFGLHHTALSKKLISEKLKAKYKTGDLISPFASLDVAGKNNPFFGRKHTKLTIAKMSKPKTFVPKWECPHCKKLYDGGNLKQHMLRHSFSEQDIEKAKL